MCGRYRLSPFGTWETGFDVKKIPVTMFEKEWVDKQEKEFREEQHSSEQPNQTRVIEKSYNHTPDEWDSGKFYDNVICCLLRGLAIPNRARRDK